MVAHSTPDVVIYSAVADACLKRFGSKAVAPIEIAERVASGITRAPTTSRTPAIRKAAEKPPENATAYPVAIGAANPNKLSNRAAGHS
jgi:hypothetical protein